MAPDSYWLRIAECETGGNWSRVERFGGALGIFQSTWGWYGGGEFGANPGHATREQQILVANRISTQGWLPPHGSYRPPVGFGGWGCVQSVGRPVLLVHTEDAVSAQPYTWGQTGALVKELQAVLGVKITGVYDRPTREAHQRLVADRRLPASLVPEIITPELPPVATLESPMDITSVLSPPGQF
jgi:hypothetical protein